MRASGLSQRAFAEQLGIDRSLLQRYLGGSSQPGFAVLVRMVKTSGCSAGWLLAGLGEPFEAAPSTSGSTTELIQFATKAFIESAETLIRAVELASSTSLPDVDEVQEIMDRLVQTLKRRGGELDGPPAAG